MPQRSGDGTPAGGGTWADEFEHGADEAVRRPVGQADAATGTADAQELAAGARRVGREHHAERGDDGVEAVVVEWERLRVSDLRGEGRPSAEARRAAPSGRDST